MAVREFIPIRLGRKGLLVHATTIESNRRTICNKKCDGGIIEPGKLSCERCIGIIEEALDRPKKKTKTKIGKRKVVR
jgi:hypothetical protein